MIVINFISVAFAIAIVAVVYSCVLTEPGEVFSGWYTFLRKKIMARSYTLEQMGKNYFEGDLKNSNGKVIRNYESLFRLLIGCEKCIAGQLALWYYLIKNYSCYQWDIHIALVASTIFASIIIKSIYQLCHKQNF